DAGVMLLPGAGFAVVPSNCLAAHLHERLPSADRLRLAFAGQDDISPGTARTAAQVVGDGVAVCEDGQIRMVPYGSLTHEIDPGPGFDGGRMGIYPWPEAFTANRSPGFDTVYVYAPEVLGLGPSGQRVMGRLQPLLRLDPIQRLASNLADQFVTGPDAETRAEESQFFWGRADDGERSVSARLDLPEDYRFTALAMVEIASRVLDGDAPAGYQTPASAYGPELVTVLDDSRLVEDPESE
ncbi:MAG: saccharopine dehydrogenase, partial [Halobaculum sp.]